MIDAWTRSSKYIALVKFLPIWPIFDWATPFLGRKVAYQHHLSEDPKFGREIEPDRVCRMRPEQIGTFDGVGYTKHPSTCWVVTAQIYRKEDSFVILTRQSQMSSDSHTEVKILVTGVAKIEILSGKQLKVYFI